MSDADVIQHVCELLLAELGSDLQGILAGGSRLRGEGDKHSDIDLVVVIALPQRRRRNIVVERVEVEMMINPLFQVRRDLEAERMSGRGLMQHLLSTGQIIYDPHEVLAALQVEARAQWMAGPPPLSATAQWQIRYAHADQLRDIADVVEHDNLRAAYLIGRCLPQVLDDHYRIQRRWRCKPKRVLLDLAGWDQHAVSLTQQVIAGTLEERFGSLQALVEHVLAPLGGPMPRAWHSEWEEVTQ